MLSSVRGFGCHLVWTIFSRNIDSRLFPDSQTSVIQTFEVLIIAFYSMLFHFQCDELRDIVTEEYWPWMAQYLVMKRASIELNFHTLYSNFLDVLKIPELNQMVLRETFRNIKVSYLLNMKLITVTMTT